MNERGAVAGLLVPLLMIAFAGIYWLANRDVPAMDMRMVRPLTIALALMSLLQVWRWFAVKDHGGEQLNWSRLKRPALLTLATLILLFGANLDFPLAASIFLAASLPILGMRRPLTVASVAILFPLVVFWAFTSLGVPLNSLWIGG